MRDLDEMGGADGRKLARLLQLEATEHFENGRLLEAIDCVRRAAALDPDELIARAVRLPMWLQADGKFEAAISEFEKLLADVPRRVAVTTPRPRDRRSLEHAMLSEIYQKMATAYRRQGLSDQSEKFASLSRKHYGINQRSVRRFIAKSRAGRPGAGP
jgi:tetratricopeptide (TPR) repeat protein